MSLIALHSSFLSLREFGRLGGAEGRVWLGLWGRTLGAAVWVGFLCVGVKSGEVSVSAGSVGRDGGKQMDTWPCRVNFLGFCEGEGLLIPVTLSGRGLGPGILGSEAAALARRRGAGRCVSVICVLRKNRRGKVELSSAEVRADCTLAKRTAEVCCLEGS